MIDIDLQVRETPGGGFSGLVGGSKGGGPAATELYGATFVEVKSKF